MIKQNNTKTVISRGGKNLIMLGAGSILIAILTTVISLVIYHNSGDIYLDRSRPGFLPDETEVEPEDENVPESEFDYERNGTTTKEGLEQYLQHFKEEIQAINDYVEPFGEKALSDERLGIDASLDGE